MSSKKRETFIQKHFLLHKRGVKKLFMTFSVCILGLSQIPSSELWSICSNQEQKFEALRQEGGSEQDSGQSQPDISTFWAEMDDACLSVQ